MNRLLQLLTLWLVAMPGMVFSQEVHLPDTISQLDLEEVVVSANRTGRKMGQLPLPVTVVKSAEIAQMGSIRLGEVLAEQTGLLLTGGHGQGVQVQGFDPDYTLILVDGEPLIGRTAGTLDLSRIALGNIEQIEIVKGPSSSLYGSEALAGVINIITKDPQGPALDLGFRYGANQSFNGSASLSTNLLGMDIYVFADRFSSAGYDFTPETFGQTAAPFAAHTLQTKIRHQWKGDWELTLSGRWFEQVQDQAFEVTQQGEAVQVAGEGIETDWNILPTLHKRLGERWKLTARWYQSRYTTNSALAFVQSGEEHSSTSFAQTFNRPEVVTEFFRNDSEVYTFGAGYLRETVAADRYREQQSFHTLYGFVQHEWQLNKRLSFISGGRFDAHSAYRSRFSPKVSGRWQWRENLHLRASVGAGFKAPDFRQLYLNFENAVAGYSVFGSQELGAALERLEAEGQVNRRLQTVPADGALNAEHSLSFQLGADWQPKPQWKASINLFHNEVQDLIEVMPFARKTNGQFVFSYMNLGRVFTQGLETDWRWQPHPAWQFSAGYQLLFTADREVLEQLQAGNVYRRNPNTLRTVRVQRSDYGGLFNRSRHSANAKVFYRNAKGWEGSLRMIWRNRYGFADLNGNSILDADGEYIRGYALCNLNAGKQFDNGLLLQVGCDNLLNFRNEAQIPDQPGRLWYLSMRYHLGLGKKRGA